MLDVSRGLPVTWLDFTALLQGSAVDLQWQTASEQNSSKFVVERSSERALNS